MTDQEAIFELTKIIEVLVFIFIAPRSDAPLALFPPNISLSLRRKDGPQSLVVFVIGGQSLTFISIKPSIVCKF
jgi:hypothetical protein